MTRRNRKCDQTKFKKRKARALENRKENKRQQAVREHAQYLIKERNQQDRLRMEKFEREWRKTEQALVNILAKRLCQLSPEYEKELRGKEAIRNLKAIGGMFGRMPLFNDLFRSTTISEEPFMAIEDEKNQPD